MGKLIAVIIIGIRSLPKKTLAGSHAMDLKDVRCARLIRKMSFLGW
jgi:hypothetical protein